VSRFAVGDTVVLNAEVTAVGPPYLGSKDTYYVLNFGAWEVKVDSLIFEGGK
jgi:hypothetical protein